jgi:hypothetical protein
LGGLWPKKVGAVLCDLWASNERQRVGGAILFTTETRRTQRKKVGFGPAGQKNISWRSFFEAFASLSERSERVVQKIRLLKTHMTPKIRPATSLNVERAVGALNPRAEACKLTAAKVVSHLTQRAAGK